MHQMLQNVGKSMEAQDLAVKEFEATIKAYDAETKRISAVQASMTPEQIQDIVLGTVHGMITSGDLVNQMPGQELPGDQNDMQMPPDMGAAPPPPDMGGAPPSDMGAMPPPDMGAIPQ
jgi:hypothetical protein